MQVNLSRMFPMQLSADCKPFMGKGDTGNFLATSCRVSKENLFCNFRKPPGSLERNVCCCQRTEGFHTTNTERSLPEKQGRVPRKYYAALEFVQDKIVSHQIIPHFPSETLALTATKHLFRMSFWFLLSSGVSFKTSTVDF